MRIVYESVKPCLPQKKRHIFVYNVQKFMYPRVIVLDLEKERSRWKERSYLQRRKT